MRGSDERTGAPKWVSAISAHWTEIYWGRAETAPEGVIAQVRVTDGSGSDYLLPYPCKLTNGGWVNAASGKPLAVGVTYWKFYVETTKRKKPAVQSQEPILPQMDRTDSG
jgi:hypothetical protein